MLYTSISTLASTKIEVSIEVATLEHGHHLCKIVRIVKFHGISNIIRGFTLLSCFGNNAPIDLTRHSYILGIPSEVSAQSPIKISCSNFTVQVLF